VIRLGVDTLSWHLRLESGAVCVEDVLESAHALGCECVQVTLHHVRDRAVADLAALRERAAELGLVLLASGDALGAGRHGDRPADALARVLPWLERAAALGSPILRVTSSFYRADLADRPDLIEVEQRFVTAALREAVPHAAERGIALLLENHSDFTAAQYGAIVEDVGPESVGVFLDVINPISSFEDPEPVVELLAPYALAGHVKDYRLRSIPTDDGYHRRGFEVQWCYPGEGAADLPRLIGAMARGIGDGDYHLTVEGLDNHADVDDQHARNQASLALLRDLIPETRS
jgi:sugar phosphate isomerase/epimerase